MPKTFTLYNPNPNFFNDTLFRIAIFGPGAVGGFFAKQCVEGGAQVSLIGKKGSKNLSRQSIEGLPIKTHDGDITTIPAKKFHYIGPLEDFSMDQTQDLVLICMKQYQFSAEVAAGVHKITNKKSIIAIITNGIPFHFLWGFKLKKDYLESTDPHGKIKNIFKDRIIVSMQPVIASQVIAGVVCISRPLDRITVSLGASKLHYANEYITFILEKINKWLETKAKIKSNLAKPRTESDLYKNILEKLQFAMSVNTLSAIMEKNIGTIFENENTQVLIHYVIEILNRVAIALEIPPLRNYQQFKSIAITKEHFSSLYHDIVIAGKVGEINAIVSAPLELIAHLQSLNYPSVKDVELTPLLTLQELLIKKKKCQIISAQDLSKLFTQCDDALNLMKQEYLQPLCARL